MSVVLSRLRRLPHWAIWVVVGPLVGAVGLGLLGPILWLLSVALTGDGTDVLAITVVVAVITAAWGLVGGLLAGALCGSLTFWLDRRSGHSTERRDAIVGVTVTSLFTVPFGVYQLVDGGLESWWDLATWLVLPVVATAAIAAYAGRWIWRLSQAP